MSNLMKARTMTGKPTLMQMIGTANVITQTPTLMCGIQYCIMRPDAVRLLAKSTTYLQK